MSIVPILVIVTMLVPLTALSAKDIGADSSTSSVSSFESTTSSTAEHEDHELVPLSIFPLPGIALPSGASIGVNSFELDILAGKSYAVRGAELGTVVNIVTHSLIGFQLAGGANIVGRSEYKTASSTPPNPDLVVRGFQMAGGFNLADGSTRGMQIAGAFNVAGGPFIGAQVAGGVNFVGEIRGVQLSLLNVASKVEGLQLGLVNIADDMQGVQLGLVNISHLGLMSFSVTYDSNGLKLIDFESGRTLFAVLFAGWRPETSFQEISYGVGFGFHAELGAFFGEADLDVKSLVAFGATVTTSQADLSTFPSLRIKVGALLGDHIGVFVGGTFDIETPWARNNPYAFNGASVAFGSGSDQVTIFPSFTAGITVRL